MPDFSGTERSLSGSFDLVDLKCLVYHATNPGNQQPHKQVSVGIFDTGRRRAI